MIEGEVGAVGAWAVEEEERGVQASGGVGGVGNREEPSTCLLVF